MRMGLAVGREGNQGRSGTFQQWLGKPQRNRDRKGKNASRDHGE